MKLNNQKFLIFITILAAASIYFFYLKDELTNSNFDKTDQSNPKVVTLFNEEIDFQIERLSSDISKPMIQQGKKNLVEYLKSVKSIRTYALHGVKSTENRNYLRMQTTFKDGETVDRSTGRSCSGNQKPCLLIRVEMENGRAKKVFTNGQEVKGSPAETQQYISTILQKLWIEDLIDNNDKYYPPKKTHHNFEKDWDNIK